MPQTLKQRKSAGRKPQGLPEDRRAAFLKPDEAHRLIGVNKLSRRSFYNGLNRGEIPSIRIGRRILVPVHAFKLWMEGKWAAGIPTA